MRKYQLDFFLKDTEEEAQECCASLIKSQSAYVNRKYKAHYTSWESIDHKEHKFVVWYVR